MHNLFLVYFVNLYVFRAYLGPSSGGKPCVYNSRYLLFCLDDCLLYWMDPYRTTDSRPERIIIIIRVKVYRCRCYRKKSSSYIDT